MPKCSPVAAAYVSSPKDWAVLTRFVHAAKRWSFLLALPHLGAPVLMWTVHQQKCKTRSATISRRETMFAARDSTHISRSPGRPQRANARLKPEVSKLAIVTPHMRKLLAHACETRVLRPTGRRGRTFYLKSNELEG